MYKILALGILSLLLAEVFFHPRITVRAQGTTIKLTNASFFIPSDTPLKIYVFHPKPAELINIIERDTASQPATFGVFVKNLSTGQEVSLNADESFTAASLYKLAVMHAIYTLEKEGKLSTQKKDVQQNLKAMITVSSNEAAWYLVNKYVNWGEVTDIIQKEGLKDTNLSVSQPKTTPKDMARLLELIANRKAVSEEASMAMLDLMLAQQRNDRIPVNLPDNTSVAHKTGELNDVRHDVGIVYSPDNDFILVLMSKGSSYPESVKPVMAKMALEIYEFFQKQWANPPEIL